MMAQKKKTTVMATPGSRVQVKPPERGIFPLDHEGECKDSMSSYLACLKANKSDHHNCRELSKAYLQCRMDKELMRKEDLNELGFGSSGEYVRVPIDPLESKETKGFIAGLGVQTKGLFKW